LTQVIIISFKAKLDNYRSNQEVHYNYDTARTGNRRISNKQYSSVNVIVSRVCTQPIATSRQFLQQAADWSRSLGVIQLADILGCGIGAYSLNNLRLG